MERISAERIFFKVLYDCKKNNFVAAPVEFHKAFYDMYKLNREKMQAFDFILRINPYSPKLEELIFYYQLCGILSRKNLELVEYEINRDRLNEIYSDEIDSFILDIPKSLIEIF